MTVGAVTWKGCVRVRVYVSHGRTQGVQSVSYLRGVGTGCGSIRGCMYSHGRTGESGGWTTWKGCGRCMCVMRDGGRGWGYGKAEL